MRIDISIGFFFNFKYRPGAAPRVVFLYAANKVEGVRAVERNVGDLRREYRKWCSVFAEFLYECGVFYISAAQVSSITGCGTVRNEDEMALGTEAEARSAAVPCVGSPCAET